MDIEIIEETPISCIEGAVADRIILLVVAKNTKTLEAMFVTYRKLNPFLQLKHVK